MDACFKLPSRNRRFKDPPINDGLAYYVNKVKYETHLAENPHAADAEVNAIVWCMYWTWLTTPCRMTWHPATLHTTR